MVMGFVGLALLVACDSVTDDVGFFGGSGGIAFDAGTPATEPLPESICESAAVGQSCAYTPDECEIGSKANITCNDVLDCNAGRWRLREAGACVFDGCAPTFGADPSPGTCDRPNANTLRCEYDEGTCGCAPVRASDLDGGDAGDADLPPDPLDDGGDAGDGGSTSQRRYVWKCIAKPEGCPRVRPRVGSECVKPMNCDYGECVFDDGQETGLLLRCSGNFWGRDNSFSCQR